MTCRRIEVTVAEAAALAEVSEITIRVWISRGHLRRTARGKVDAEQLVDYMDNPQRRHGRRRLDQRRSN